MNQGEDTDDSHFVRLQSNAFFFWEEEELFKCLAQAELESNPGRRRGRPAINRLGHSAAMAFLQAWAMARPWRFFRHEL